MRKVEKAAAEKSSPKPRKRFSQHRPLQTTVIGSYPFPGWLEFASSHLDQFATADIEELRTDAVIAAVHDQVAAGLDVITDGEQGRYDFNLSFYGRLEGIDPNVLKTRNFGPQLMTSAESIESRANSALSTVWGRSQNSHCCGRSPLRARS